MKCVAGEELELVFFNKKHRRKLAKMAYGPLALTISTPLGPACVSMMDVQGGFWHADIVFKSAGADWEIAGDGRTPQAALKALEKGPFENSHSV